MALKMKRNQVGSGLVEEYKRTYHRQYTQHKAQGALNTRDLPEQSLDGHGRHRDVDRAITRALRSLTVIW